MYHEFVKFIESVEAINKVLKESDYQITNEMIVDIYHYIDQGESKRPESVLREFNQLVHKLNLVYQTLGSHCLMPAFNLFMDERKNIIGARAAGTGEHNSNIQTDSVSSEEFCTKHNIKYSTLRYWISNSMVPIKPSKKSGNTILYNSQDLENLMHERGVKMVDGDQKALPS